MCKFCEEEEYLFNNRELGHNGAYNGFEVWIEDDKLNIYACLNAAKVVDTSDSTDFKINYCPMCGRKL